MAQPVYTNGPNDNWLCERDPTSDEPLDNGFFNKQSLWYNIALDPMRVFMCMDETIGALVWQQLSGSKIPVINNAPSRSIVTGTGATGFQISSTRLAQVSYSVTIDTTSTLSGSSKGYVVLETATTNSATPGDWVEIARIPSGQNNTVVIGVSLVQTGGGCMGGLSISPGDYVKIRSVNVSGTPTYTLTSQQERLF